MKETLEPSIEPPVSKARLNRNDLNDGVYGNVSSNSRNMRINNAGFRNYGFGDSGPIDVIQTQQNLL